METNISILIPAKNEQENIADCLESVKWSNDVWVIDSYSTDHTKKIAGTYKNVNIADFEYNGGWPKKKNWAIKNIPWKNDWIFILDADERVTPELEKEMKDAVQSKKADGFYVRWKFYFLGRWLRHCWSSGWMVRLFHKDKAQYENLGLASEGNWDNEVHENIIIEGKTGRLNNYLTHCTKKDISHWIAKHNQFSTWTAALRLKHSDIYNQYKFSDLLSGDFAKRRKAMMKLYLSLPFKPLIIFVYLFYFRFGFLDGKEGYYYCRCHAIHQFQIELKIYETGLNRA